MQIILLDKVVNLGNLGEIVKVKDGYARNFLIPSGPRPPRYRSCQGRNLKPAVLNWKKSQPPSWPSARHWAQSWRVPPQADPKSRCGRSFVWFCDQCRHC
jgi:hypothetical protein